MWWKELPLFRFEEKSIETVAAIWTFSLNWRKAPEEWILRPEKKNIFKEQDYKNDNQGDLSKKVKNQSKV